MSLPKRKLVVGALSAKHYTERRLACSMTWHGQTTDVACVFLIGGSEGPARLDGDVLHLPCPDNYQALPQKTAGFCRWASDAYDFDYLFKCDDDTYVSMPRLLEFIDSKPGDYVGVEWKPGVGYASGGAGYLLSRRAAEIVARDLNVRTGAEDVEVQKVLARAGIAFVNSPRFNPWNTAIPRASNSLITSHYCHPEQMRIIHQLRPQNEIPKLFHWIWLGPKPLPEEFAGYIAGWKALHPGWEFRLWTDNDRPPLKNEQPFRDAKNWAQKSDILRYELLHMFGGVYLDTDFECLKNIDPLLVGVSAFSAWEDPASIAVGVMGCTPGHTLFGELIDALPANIATTTNQVLQTGPGFFTKFVRDRKDITLFPSQSFYPIHYSGMTFGSRDAAYADHKWAHSWRDADIVPAAQPTAFRTNSLPP